MLPFPGLPGATGVVVTECSVSRTLLGEGGLGGNGDWSGSPTATLEVTVERTRVADSNVVGPLLDAVSVPVQQIFEALRGDGATRVKAEVTYLDADLRIARTLPMREVFVYRRF